MTAPANASIGSLAKLGMGAAEPVTEFYEFTTESMAKLATIVNPAGIRGRRSIPGERSRAGTYKVSGGFTLNPGPAELANLLPRILGGAAVANVYNPTDSLPSFFVVVDKIAQVHHYTGCKVSKATFRGQEGQPIQLMLEIEGIDETLSAAGSMPAGEPTLDAPYMFFDSAGAITIAGSVYQVKEFEIVIDNMLDGDRFMNSQKRTELPTRGRTVTAQFTVPWTTDELGLYNMPVLGQAASVVLTNGANSCAINVGLLEVPAESPKIVNRDEATLTLRGTCRTQGSGGTLTNEISFTSTNS